MPYPTKYTRQYDFQGYQVSNPTRPLPGDKVNVDLNAVKQSVDEIVEFLKNFSRSDGHLANGSVGVNQLDATFELGFSLPTTWEAHVDYTADSTVLYANKFWKSKAAHTSSGGFDESKWDEIVDFGAQADAAAASAAAALASENAAEASAEDAAADRVQTGLDVVATAADRVQTGVDAAAAAAAFDLIESIAAHVDEVGDEVDANRALAEDARDQAIEAAQHPLPDGSVTDAKLTTSLKGRLVAFVADRTALAQLDGSTYQSADLMEAGIKGIFQWSAADLSAAVTADTRQAIYVPPASDTSGASGAWVRRIENAAQFNWWRPAKNGATDDTSIFNEAISYASAARQKLIVDAGSYSVDEITVVSYSDLEFMPGARLIQPNSGSVAVGHVIRGTGATTGAAVSLTANVSAGGWGVSVAAGAESAFTAGDYVLVYDNDFVFTPAIAGLNQEVMIVSSVASGAVVFTRRTTTSFSTSNSAKIVKLNPLRNVRIHGPVDITCGLNRQYGIRLTYPVHCRIFDGVQVRRSRGGGSFVFQTGFDSHIYNCLARDGQSPSTGGTGYGVSFDESCVYCSVRHCYFENLRENTYTNRTRWCVFENNINVGMVDSGWNCHGAGSDNNVCRGNTFNDCSQAVAVGWTGATRGDSYNIVENNYMYLCTNGISISGNATGPVVGSGNVVKGNRIRNCSSRGVSVAYQSAFTVADNVIDDSATLSNGIYVVAGCALGNISGNRILNITTAGATGIRVDAATDVMVSHNVVNRMTGASATGFYVPAGNTDVRVQLNAAMDHGTVNLAGAALNTLNTWN